MDADYPTAADCRAIAETLYWLSNRTSGHEGSDDRELYRTRANQMMNVATKLEANPNYFTERTALRAA